MNKSALLASAAMLLTLTGCIDSNGYNGHRTGLYASVAGAGCGMLASTVGHGSNGRRLLHGLLAGSTCAAIGGAIGHELDEADQEHLVQARAQALQQRLPPQYYRPGFRADAYQTASGYGGAAPSGTGIFGRKRAPARSDGTPADPADVAPAAPSSSGRFPGLTPVQGAKWVSDHSGASGSVTVVSAERPKNGHGECRTLAQIVRQPGQSPATEETRVCESAPGASDWATI